MAATQALGSQQIWVDVKERWEQVDQAVILQQIGVA